MDPITAALTLANTLLTFGIRVYEDTPIPARQANADNWAKFVHNIGDSILGLQSKVNAAVK